MALLTIDDVEKMSETAWGAAKKARAEMLLAGVLGWITRNAPCLDVPSPEPAMADEAKMIVTEAILRAVEGSNGNVASESIGPSTVGYIDRTSKPTLTRADEASLKALCPAATKRKRYGTIRTRPGYLPTTRF